MALNQNREIEQLRREQGDAAAFALYRKYYFTPYDAPLDPLIVTVRGLHTRHFATWLTREGRTAEAEALIAEYIDLSHGLEDKIGWTSTRLVELQIYLAAGRGDVPAVLRLLDQHQRFDRKLQRDGACFNGDFPGHVAPTQHDPRVAAKLRAMGCRQEIIDQLDDLASRGLERNMFEPGLPPRPLPKARP